MTDYDDKAEGDIVDSLENPWGFKLLTIDDLLDLPEEEESWLVNSIVLNSGITTVSGLPNHFKSLFVQCLCIAVASGNKFLNTFEVEKGGVLVIDREVPPKRLVKRWKLLEKLKGLPLYFYPYKEPFRLDDENLVRKISDIIQTHKIKLLVIDTFNRSHGGKDINSAHEVTKLFEPLKQLINDISIILVHHSSKKGYSKEIPTPEELLGSTDFMAETDVLFTLRKRNEKEIAVHNLKAKDSELLKSFEIELNNSESDSLKLEYKGDFIPKKTDLQKREERIIEILKTKKTKKEELIKILVEDGENEGTINNTLTNLKRKKIIRSQLEGREAYYFLLEKYRTDEHFIPREPPREVKQLSVSEYPESKGKKASQGENEVSEGSVKIAEKVFGVEAFDK